ncbi:MAG: DUF2769 domain-containing protein [Actinobacteria bacterium]|jgi:hypothetical protein|nr:DUF2769 domain-containing protein [Actinomycetota bacterium]
MKVPDTQENLMKCICGSCPSHNQCMKDKMQGLFCAREKSDCEIEKKGCICGQCPLFSEYGLENLYYCINGAEE